MASALYFLGLVLLAASAPTLEAGMAVCGIGLIVAAILFADDY
jgi:hypothetical protein